MNHTSNNILKRIGKKKLKYSLDVTLVKAYIPLSDADVKIDAVLTRGSDLDLTNSQGPIRLSLRACLSLSAKRSASIARRYPFLSRSIKTQRH